MEAVRVNEGGKIYGTIAQVKIQLAGVELEGTLELVGVNGEEGSHVHGSGLPGAEGLTVQHIGLRVGNLILYQPALGGGVHDMPGQGGGIGDAGRKHGGGGVFPGLHHAHDGHGLAVGHKLLQEGLVVRFIHPGAVGIIVLVAVGCVDQLEGAAQKIAVPVGLEILGHIHILVLGELLDHLVQLGVVPQAQRVEGIISDGTIRTQHGNALVVVFGPAACLDLVLGMIQGIAGGQLVEHAGVHHAGHHVVGRAGGADAQSGKGGIRVHLPDAAVRVLAVDLRLDIIGILHRGNALPDAAGIALEVGFQALQVVGGDAGNHLGHELAHRHHPFAGGGGLAGQVGGQQAGQIHAAAQDLHRVLGKGVPLHIGDILVDTGGQGNDQRNADDADRACKGREQGAGLFGPEVVEAQGQRGPPRHGGVAHVLVNGRGKLSGVGLVGGGVGADDTILQVHDAGGVLLGQLRVVGDHDHQPVLCHLLEQLHDLDAGLAVQRAGGLVCQQDIRVVDQCTGNGNALHLAAGHFAGVLVQLIAQPHLLQRLGGAALALCARDAGNGQGQLHVGQNGLMRDQVVALEHKADGVVAVGVPIAVGVLFCGDPVDDKVTAVVPVQAADDVQQGGLTGAGGAQDGDKFAVAQVQADIIQCGLYKVTGFVFLADLFQL